MALTRKKSCCILVLIILFSLVSYVSIADFSVGLTLIGIDYNLSGAKQLNSSVPVNGLNVTISIPVLYTGSGLFNTTMQKPSGWYNGSNWYIHEDGQTRNVTTNETHLFWEANISSATTSLIFEVPSPHLMDESELQSMPFYEHNFTIASANHFTNVSITISINGSYDTYTLFWFSSGDWINVTDTYHLTILNDSASFYGFSTSDQYFRFQGYCVPNWSCSDWSACSTGTQTRSCTDSKNCSTIEGMPSLTQSCSSGTAAASGGGGGGGVGKPELKNEVDKTFDVSPKVIRLKLKEQEIAKKFITIENTGNVKQKFRISSNTNFISLSNTSAVVDTNASGTIELTFNTKYLQPDSYFAEILVSNGEQEQEIFAIMEIESEKKIIDVQLDINPEYTNVKQGDVTTGTITLYNLFKDPTNVALDYSIKDLDGNTVFHEQEQGHVDYQISFEKKFQIPLSIKDGSYIISVRGSVQNITSVSSVMIQVQSEIHVKIIEKPVQLQKPMDKYIIILIIILTAMLFILTFYRIDQVLRERARIAEVFAPQVKKDSDIRKRRALEMEMLRKQTAQEKIRLQNEREIARKLLQQKQKIQEKLLIEKHKKQKELEHVQDQRRFAKLKKVRDFLRVIGIYKTRDEKKQAQLLQIATKLEMKKLEERRNVWLTKQKELDIRKIEKEKELVLLKINGQQKEQELADENIPVSIPRRETPNLFKLSNAEPRNLDIPQLPSREATLSLDLLQTLLEKAFRDIANFNLDGAYRSYVEIRTIYQRLPEELRKQVLSKCTELHDKLMEKFGE